MSGERENRAADATARLHETTRVIGVDPADKDLWPKGEHPSPSIYVDGARWSAATTAEWIDRTCRTVKGREIVTALLSDAAVRLGEQGASLNSQGKILDEAWEREEALKDHMADQQEQHDVETQGLREALALKDEALECEKCLSGQLRSNAKHNAAMMERLNTQLMALERALSITSGHTKPDRLGRYVL